MNLKAVTVSSLHIDDFDDIVQYWNSNWDYT